MFGNAQNIKDKINLALKKVTMEKVEKVGREEDSSAFTQEEHGKCHVKVQSTAGIKVPLRKKNASSDRKKARRRL